MPKDSEFCYTTKMLTKKSSKMHNFAKWRRVDGKKRYYQSKRFNSVQIFTLNVSVAVSVAIFII